MTEEMTMNNAPALAGRDNRTLTVTDYEARIYLYREQIGVGYIGIGRTLNEAKEAQVVPAGQWEDWMTRVTGLTVRQAQRCMQAAREIRDGSALARLEMSKAMRLLSSGLSEDEREELARKTQEDNLTVKALEDEIRKLRETSEQSAEMAKMWEERARESFAQGERAALVEKNLAQVQADGEAERLRGKLRDAAAAQQSMQASLDRMSEQRADLSLKLDQMRGQLHLVEQRAELAERKARDLQANEGARSSEQYRKGRDEGAAEQARAFQAEKDRLSADLKRMQETMSRQLEELNDLRRRDRAARMSAARGQTDGPDAQAISALILRFLTQVGTLPPNAYRRDGALAGELTALESWIGRAHDLLGVTVDGEVR